MIHYGVNQGALKYVFLEQMFLMPLGTEMLRPLTIQSRFEIIVYRLLKLCYYLN
jgi:hypothetical protein